MVQNHFIRIILNKRKRESSFALFSQLKILPIQHLFIFKVLRVFYARSGNLGTTDLEYATRSIDRRMFRVPKLNKYIFKQSFIYNGPKFFNNLPTEIKESCNINQFCSKLKRFLFSSPDTHVFYV